MALTKWRNNPEFHDKFYFKKKNSNKKFNLFLKS